MFSELKSNASLLSCVNVTYKYLINTSKNPRNPSNHFGFVEMLGSNVGKKVTANLVQDQYNEFLKNKDKDNKVKKPVLTAEERKLAKREEMRKRGIMVKADDKDEAPTIIEKGDGEMAPCVFKLPEKPIKWKKVVKKASIETQRRGGKSKKKKSAESDKVRSEKNGDHEDKSKNKSGAKAGTPEKRERKKRKPKPVHLHLDTDSKKSKSKTKMPAPLTAPSPTPAGRAPAPAKATGTPTTAATPTASTPTAVKEEQPASEPHETTEEGNSSAEKMEPPPTPAQAPAAAVAPAQAPAKTPSQARAQVAAQAQAPIAPVQKQPSTPGIVASAPTPIAEPAPTSDPKKEPSGTKINEKTSDASLKVAIEPSAQPTQTAATATPAATPATASVMEPITVTTQKSASSTRTENVVAVDNQQDAFGTLDDEEFEKVAAAAPSQLNDHDEKEILRMAPKILKIAKRHKAMEKCLTPAENETLAKFFSGKHPLTPEVLAVLDVALDKIIDYLHKNNLAIDDETKNIIKHRDKLKAAMMKEFLVSPQYLPKTWTAKFNQWKAEAEKQKYGINWFRILFAYPKHKSFDDGPEDMFGNFNKGSRGLLLGLILGPADVKSFEETKREEDCQGMFLDTKLIEHAGNEPDLTSATKTYVNLDKLDKQGSETKMLAKNNAEKKKEEKPTGK